MEYVWLIEKKFKYLHVTKRRKGTFHEFNWVEAFSCCAVFSVFSMSKN